MATQSYLTPARFLSGGYGIDTSTLTTASLRNTLMRASTIVDTFCNGSMFPNRYDFRGGTMTDEQHEWPFTPPLLQTNASRRVYLNTHPIRSITSFVVRLSTNYTITLDPATSLYINAMSGYVEVVALAPTIAGFWPAGYPLGLYTPVAEVSYTYGWQFPVEGDVCEAESPTLYTSSHGNWLSTADVTVYVDGVEVSSGDYSINYDDGSVTFDDDPEPQEVVTVDYTYVLPDAISQATGLVATDLIARSRIAARGMIGLQSIKVAEVALTQMAGDQAFGYVTKNGVRVPSEAGLLLGPYVKGSTG